MDTHGIVMIYDFQFVNQIVELFLLILFLCIIQWIEGKSVFWENENYFQFGGLQRKHLNAVDMVNKQ